jgi:hypothetical protein
LYENSEDRHEAVFFQENTGGVLANAGAAGDKSGE